MRTKRTALLAAGLCVLLLWSGCGGVETTTTAPTAAPTNAAPKAGGASAQDRGATTFPAVSESDFVTEELVHVKLREANPGYNLRGQFQIENNTVRAAVLANTGVQDLSPLRGLPLRGLDLQGCPVTDLFHLKGMPLEMLYLDGTRVFDLRPVAGAKLQSLYANDTGIESVEPLRGMPLKELNLAGAKVNDISPLADCPIEMLWLSHCPVEDISALKGMPLVSATLHGTKVTDLEPLRGHPTLQRLHIGDTPVTDIRPLAGLQLQRLIFPIDRVEKGLDVARGMFSLTEVGTTFENMGSPTAFWPAAPRPAPESTPPAPPLKLDQPAPKP